MKKLMMSIFIVTALASCSSENEIIDDGGIKGDERVEIKLNGGVSAITKAIITPTLAADLDVIFVRPEDGTEVVGSASWTLTGTDNLLYAKVSKDGDADGNHPITFYADENRSTLEKQYYNIDENKYTYLVGFYTGDAIPSITNGVVSFTIDGTQDIMATTAIAASKKNQFTSFSFKHKLSQLAFKVKAENAKDELDIKNLYGQIKKIEVLNQPTTLNLRLGETPTIESTGANNGTFTIAPTPIDIQKDAAQFGDPLMVYADSNIGNDSNPISLKIFTEKFPAGIEASVTLGTAGLDESKTHSIELNFSKTEINAKTTIEEWTNSSNNGSGTIKQ